MNELHELKYYGIELIDGDRGYNYPKKEEFKPEGHCLFLDSKNVTSDGFDFSNTVFITKEKDEILRNGKLKRGDIVLTTRGTVGNISLYDESVPYEHIRINSGMLILRCSEKYPSRLLFYLFKSGIVKEQINNMISGSVQHQLPVSVVNRIQIPEPKNLNVNLLSVIDKKITINNQVLKCLEAMAKTLYDYWFVQFDFPDDNGHPYKTSGGKMEWNEILSREIPTGWEVQKVGSLIKKQKSVKSIERKNYSSNGKYPIVDQSIEYIAGYTNDEVNALGDEDSIIIFGDHTRILKYVDFPFVIGADGTQRIVSKNKERMPQVLFYYSLARIDLSNYGYARHYKFLKDSMIVVPPKDVARHFEMQVKFWRHIISKKIRENRYLEELRDFILPMLMNGQVTFRQ